MTTQEQCLAIVKRIVELAYKGKPVTIEELEIMIGHLYNAMHDGPGLLAGRKK